MKLQHTCDPPSPTPARYQDEEEDNNNNEDVVYELRVINACVQNDDVVLPRRPQVALLAPFYQYAWHSALDTIEPHDIERRVTDTAQNGKVSNGKEDVVVVRSSSTIKKPTYRRHHSFSGKRRTRQKRTAHNNTTTSGFSTMNRSVTNITSSSSGSGKWQAHVPLTAAQWLEHTPHIILGRHSTLPHNYRLPHDCVSRLHARVVYVNNRVAHDYFTRTYPLVQTQQKNEDNKDDECVDRNCDEGSSTHTAIEHTTIIEEQGSNNSNGGVSRRKGFDTPYYLLINHSENMTYVNTQGISRGRSCILSEGDVVSVLECAYDIDGGILDQCADPAAAAQTKTSSNSNAECVDAQKDEEQEEEDNDALVWCTQHAVRPERFTQLQSQVQATLTAVTRGHDKPTAMDIDEVVKDEEDKKEEEHDTLHRGILRTMDSVSSSAGVVEVHGRVIARRRALEVHSSVKEYLQHYKLQNITFDVKRNSVWTGVAWPKADEQERLLQQLLIHAAEEEENDADVLSPLNGLLRLNVGALRRALLQRKQQQQQQAVKEEEESEVYVIGQRLTLREASVSIIDVDALDEESNDGRRSTTAAASDELESSPLKQLIAELQLNTSTGTTPNGKNTKAEDVNTRQIMEAHSLSIFPLSTDEEGNDASSSLEQIPTACDFITLQPALLPVYVFTRQSTNSPSRYTCERRTMRPLHSNTNDDPQQPAYIYYYYEDKENDNNTPGKEKKEEQEPARSEEEVGGWSILRPKDRTPTTTTTNDREDNVNRQQDDEQQQYAQRWRTSSSGSAGSSLLHHSSLFSPSAIPRGTVVAETASYKRIRSNTTTTLVSTTATAANGTGCLVIDEPSPIDHTTCTSNNKNEDDVCTTLSDLEAAVWIDETSEAQNMKGGVLHKGGRLRRRHRHRW